MEVRHLASDLLQKINMYIKAVGWDFFLQWQKENNIQLIMNGKWKPKSKTWMVCYKMEVSENAGTVLGFVAPKKGSGSVTQKKTKYQILDEKIDNNFNILDKKIDDNFNFLNKKIDDSVAMLNKKIDDNFEFLNKKIDNALEQILGAIAQLSKKLDDHIRDGH